jgi:hypothetical protein
MQGVSLAASRRAVPVDVIRVDAITFLLDQGELEVANLLFACELELERLPIGASCLRAQISCAQQDAQKLDLFRGRARSLIRRALERTLPRGWVLVALVVDVHDDLALSA